MANEEHTASEAPLEVISRAEAKARGLKFFFTGKPCKRQHICERAVRNGGCRECTRIAQLDWYGRNSDVVRARSAAWYRANTQRALELAARWKAEHPDQRRLANQIYYESNKTKIASYKKQWASENKDRLKTWFADYAINNKTAIRLNHKRWRQANPDKLRVWTNLTRARRRGAEGKYTPKDIDTLFRLQRGRCAYCRGSLRGGYHIDHIVPVILGGTNWPANLQLTCEKCNCSKGGKEPIAFARSKGLLL